jgi:threonine aldolase
MIDLRSDTVTKPTPAMRRAMADADVGDDVYGEDPTVNRLQQRAAEIFGKDAALFVPTGTMGNTIGIKMQTNHGEEVICDARSHILDWELSMTAWFSGCLLRTIETDNGILTWDRIASKLRPDGPHCAPTTLLEIENTHNMCGGVVYPQDVLDDICDRAHAVGMKVHMDGARVFNAAAAAGTPVKRICERVDSVNFCLSKGLGAPVGSILVGGKEAIARGHKLRKRLGGGMRQVGVLAAAGLIALEEMPGRLSEDHANARYLAEEGAKIPGIAIDASKVETNIVIYDVAGTGKSTAEISAALKSRGVLMNGVGGTRLRAVTHYDVTRSQCETAIAALREVLAQ